MGSNAVPVAARNRCLSCPGDCLDACFNDAIVAANGGGVAILAELCAGCGACLPACAFGLIRLDGGVASLVDP